MHPKAICGMGRSAKVGNWLWKLVFGRHSQICLKVALWMLQILETASRDVFGWHRRCQKNLKGSLMDQQTIRLGPRERQIVELLLQGCDNAEIATQLNMARRTVKAHFNRLFLRFGINGGIKRVKLATMLYRRQACLQMNVMDPASQVSVNTESSSLLPKA
jgi:DNA-binding CsgD family transcriptional regulator